MFQSPGCGPTDICVALADNYARPGQRTSVCASEYIELVNRLWEII